jgi:hypothetical protein
MLKDIKSFKYIDFSEMLKLMTGQELKDKSSVVLAISADGKVKQQPDDEKKRRPNLGRATWQSVFDSWIHLSGMYNPGEQTQLNAYRGILSKLERKYMMHHPMGFTIYDFLVRRAVDRVIRSNPKLGTQYGIQWGVLDEVIEAEVFGSHVPASCIICGATNHPTEECTPVLASAAATAVGKAAMMGTTTTNQTCYGYNKMYGQNECTRQPCTHEHSCNGCRGDHPVYECPKRTGGQSKKTQEKKD